LAGVAIAHHVADWAVVGFGVAVSLNQWFHGVLYVTPNDGQTPMSLWTYIV
jgi:hypothetical protein